MNQLSFRKGLLDGLPIGLGYLSVSFAFGIFAVNSGLSAAEASLISMTCLTSAGQLAAVPIMVGGGSLPELIVSQIVINLRYSLMSISLSQKLDSGVTIADRFAVAFFNTDEIFAVASSQPGQVGRGYLYGLGVLPWIGWTGGDHLRSPGGQCAPGGGDLVPGGGHLRDVHRHRGPRGPSGAPCGVVRGHRCGVELRL